MQFEIEYPIVVHGRPKRANSEKVILARDTLVIDVPEFASSELLRAVDLDADFYDGLSNLSLDALEGGLYASVAGPAPEKGLHQYQFRSKNPQLTPFVAAIHEQAKDALSRAFRWQGVRIFPPVMERAIRFDDSEELVVPPTLEEVRGDLDEAAVEQARSQFLSHMQRYILVDGQLLKQEPEPVLVVWVDKYASNSVTVQPLRRDEAEPYFGSYAHDCIPAAVFRLDQADDALEYAEDILQRSNEAYAAPVLRNHLRSSIVHDQRLLSYDERAATIRCVAEWVLMKSVHLGESANREEMGRLRQASYLPPEIGGPILEEEIDFFRSLPPDAPGNPFIGYGSELLPTLWNKLGQPDIVFEI